MPKNNFIDPDRLTLIIHFADYVDSSGLQIFYTPTKRQYDGAVLEFGHVPTWYGVEFFLPPGRDNIITKNFCPAACTQAVKKQLLCNTLILMYIGSCFIDIF